MLLLTANVLKFRTFYSVLFWPKFCFLCRSFLKILSGMANNVDPDQTAPIQVCTVCICHFSDTLVFEILGHLPYFRIYIFTYLITLTSSSGLGSRFDNPDILNTI